MRNPSIPHPRVVSTGEQGQVQPIIDNFFRSVRDYVVLKRGREPDYFETKSRELSPISGHVTDDRMTYLSWMDIVIAGVLET